MLSQRRAQEPAAQALGAGSGALWAFAPVLMYVFGMVYAMTIGAQATPPTVLAGAVLLVISGVWMAFSVLRRPSAQAVDVQAQPSMQ